LAPDAHMSAYRPLTGFTGLLRIQLDTQNPEQSCKSCLSKSAKEYSIHSASLDGDEFGIVGASPTINSAYKIY
jgi:hypothetical protein